MKQQRGLFFILCIALFMTLTFFPSTALADNVTVSGKCDTNGRWTLENGVLTISGSGSTGNYYVFSPAPWYYYRDSITSVLIESGVNSIGSWAFYNCRNLKSVIIPDSVMYIWNNAFDTCASLTNVTIPNSVDSIGAEAFQACVSLSSLTIPSSVTSLGDGAFASCTSLTSLTIPDSVTFLGERMFNKCINLTNVMIPDGVAKIKRATFSGCKNLTSVTIPNSVTDIEAEAFYGCTRLTSVTIPNSVTYIGKEAFYSCDGLTSMIIPDSVASIEESTFRHCAALTNVVILDSVTEIKAYAFKDCAALTSVTIPNSVIGIGYNAFHYCVNLADVYYWGTEEQWKKISISSDNNYYFTRATIHYNSPAPVPTPPVDTSFTIAFDPNGGIGSIDSVTCANGNSIRLPASTFYRQGYTFNGWNTKADGTGTAYQNLTQITPTDNITLYAQWLGEVTFEQESYEVEEEETVTVTATIPDMASGGGLIWTPDNETASVVHGSNHSQVSREGICTVSVQVRGNVAGLCTLTLTLPDGRSGSCQIKTKEAKYSLPLYQDGYLFAFRSSLKDNRDQDIEMEYTYHYDESWFLRTSTNYQHELVKMSIRGAMAAYGADGKNSTPKNIVNLMEKMKFSNIQTSYPRPNVSSVNTKDNTIGYAIGSKNIRTQSGEQFSLIMIAVRGGGYYDEWGDNFNVGTGTEHAGFSNAARKVVDGLKQYLSDYGDSLDSQRKIWIMGYSRGAATTNIAAKNLDDGIIPGIKADNVYAFCFECPQNTRSEDWSNPRYNNIISIVNPIDFVPKVAMSDWGYHRYGRTYYTPYRAGLVSEEYSRMEDRMRTYYANLIDPYPNREQTIENLIPDMNYQSPKLDAAMYALATVLGSPDSYQEIQPQMIDLFRINMGASNTVKRAAFDITVCLKAICDGDVFKNASQFKRVIKKGAFVGVPALKWYFFGEGKEVLGLASDAIGEAIDFQDVANSHMSELCLSWIDSLEGELSYSSAKKRVIYVNCPVDVKVYDSAGALVGNIENNVVENIENGVYSYIDANGQKVITLPVGEEYAINMTATDDGTVTYSATCYNMENGDTEQVVSYHNIPIVTGETLTAVAENLDDLKEAEKAAYSLEKGGVSLEPDVSASDEDVKTYDVDIRADKNGTATGGGMFVMGEYAQATAEPEDGYVFDGWYHDSALFSMENPYRFLVEKDLALIAKFSPHKNTVSIGEVTANAQSVQATVICPNRQASVYCAIYQNSGQMVLAHCSQVTNEDSYNFTFSGYKFDYAKVFILDENLCPLCASKQAQPDTNL